MYDQPNIAEELLRACLQAEYDLRPISLEFLPLGLDSRAGVYRVMGEEGDAYLLKVKQGTTLYEPGCYVPRYLYDHGVTSVVAPLATKAHALWTTLEGWTVLVYPFIDGESGWNTITDEHWKAAGSIFRQIHQVMPPASGFEAVRKETFDPTEYARWIRAFEDQHLHQEGGSAAERALRDAWMAHQSTISLLVASLEKLAGALQKRTFPYVICHADFHASNLLRTQDGQVFVIDWDDVMLAPKERDFIFVQETPAAGQTLSAFFQGYGQTEIDWAALAYYRYERVIQDVIAYAEEACLRDDLSEETRANSVQSFQKNLAGSMIASIEALATRLPPDSSKG